MVFEPPQPPEPPAPGTSGASAGRQPPAMPPRPAWMAPPPVPPGPVTDLQPPPPPPAGRPWRWVLAFVVVVAIIAAAAVVATNHGSSKSASPTTTPTSAQAARRIIAAASGRTSAAGTARTSSSETITEHGQSFELFEMNGATDYAHKASAVTMSTQGTTIETIRSVGGVSYLSAAGVALPGGAHWVSLRPSDIGVSGESTLGSSDPNTGLGYLTAVNGDPHVVGPATIDGVATTKYTFTIDLQSFLDQTARAASKLGASLPGMGSLKGLVDLTKIPGSAWIDEAGRVRQFEFTLAVSALGQSVKTVAVLEFSHFGEPVSVAAPAASDTVPFSSVPQFFSQLQASIAGTGSSA